ncbi:MAG: hypothetical protein HY650_15235 [Acidobacteria bacterium]|nr:hypothetical protein [Acidobacteriota bacterium]
MIEAEAGTLLGTTKPTLARRLEPSLTVGLPPRGASRWFLTILGGGSGAIARPLEPSLTVGLPPWGASRWFLTILGGGSGAIARRLEPSLTVGLPPRGASRRLMIVLGLLLASFCAFLEPSSAGASEDESLESGEYRYYIQSQPVGTETFMVRSGARGTTYTGTSDLTNGRFVVHQVSELGLDLQSKPERFSNDARVNGQRTRVSITFGDDGASWRTEVEDRTETNRVAWPRDQLLIADNVIHHLTALVRRYDTAKPGTQFFARTLSGTKPGVELVRQTTVTTGTVREVFFKFRVLAGEQRLYLWTNSDNLVIKAIQPDRHFEAVLRGWEIYAARLGVIDPNPN